MHSINLVHVLNRVLCTQFAQHVLIRKVITYVHVYTSGSIRYLSHYVRLLNLSDFHTSGMYKSIPSVSGPIFVPGSSAGYGRVEFWGVLACCCDKMWCNHSYRPLSRCVPHEEKMQELSRNYIHTCVLNMCILVHVLRCILNNCSCT